VTENLYHLHGPSMMAAEIVNKLNEISECTDPLPVECIESLRIAGKMILILTNSKRGESHEPESPEIA
tara:strand:- start:776 stop:979 length:204 start_codon:yes stop_codon:yes gene_type:complete